MAVDDVFTALPVLRTERLTLRRLTEAEGEGLFDIFADDQLTEYYAWDTFTDLEQGHELAIRSVEQYRQQEAMRWGPRAGRGRRAGGGRRAGRLDRMRVARNVACQDGNLSGNGTSWC
jgi:hypothetical protein